MFCYSATLLAQQKNVHLDSCKTILQTKIKLTEKELQTILIKLDDLEKEKQKYIVKFQHKPDQYKNILLVFQSKKLHVIQLWVPRPQYRFLSKEDLNLLSR
jgi:hypothetical protein